MNLETIRSWSLALPEVTEEPHHNFGSFRVKGKIFITVPPGDEYIHVFLPEVERERALALYPKFIEKLFWGKKVAGVRVNLSDSDPAVVKNLVQVAWHHKASKRLRSVGGGTSA